MGDSQQFQHILNGKESFKQKMFGFTVHQLNTGKVIMSILNKS